MVRRIKVGGFEGEKISRVSQYKRWKRNWNLKGIDNPVPIEGDPKEWKSNRVENTRFEGYRDVSSAVDYEVLLVGERSDVGLFQVKAHGTSSTFGSKIC